MWASINWRDAVRSEEFKRGNPHWNNINTTMGKIKVQGGANYIDKKDPLRPDYDAFWSNAKGIWDFTSTAPDFVRMGYRPR